MTAIAKHGDGVIFFHKLAHPEAHEDATIGCCGTSNGGEIRLEALNFRAKHSRRMTHASLPDAIRSKTRILTSLSP